MSLPEAFIRRTQELFPEEYRQLIDAIDSEPPVSIRFNPLKGAHPADTYERVAWAKEGYYLPERYTFTFDPHFHAGMYYVQEASSMFLGHVIRQYVQSPVRYLDLCAAPGGKSTDAIASLPEGSLVVCNEIVRNRAHILAENIAKWGAANCFVSNNEAGDFARLTHYFDVVAVDAPCSGEGMFRKDEASRTEWSVENVAQCAARQHEILSQIWNALRPGGLLIYSTCTYNREENEDIVEYLCREFDAEPLPVETCPEWGIRGAAAGNRPVYRFMPHLTRGEGIFMCVLRKPDGETDDREQLYAQAEKRLKRNKQKTATPSVPKDLTQKLLSPERFRCIAQDDRVTAIPETFYRDYTLLQSTVNLLHAGIPMASVKGNDYIPSQALALSTELNRSQIHCADIDLSSALAYLRRETIQLPAGLPKGYILLTFEGSPLGWVKNIGNRSNNLYPQEWRIRSGYQPDEIKRVALMAE